MLKVVQARAGVGRRRLARGAFRRRRLERPPGRGERPRRRLREPLPLGLRLLLGRRRLLVLGEDLLLRLAREQPLELVLVDRLALDEDRRAPPPLGRRASSPGRPSATGGSSGSGPRSEARSCSRAPGRG